MKTLSTILISTLLFSSTAFSSIPNKPIAIQNSKTANYHLMYRDNYSSLSQVPDEQIPQRKIKLTDKDRLPITYPKGTIDLFK